MLRGCRDQLPESRCTSGGERVRVEGAFDDRDQGDFGGQPALGNGLDQVGEIARGAWLNTLQQFWLPGKPIERLAGRGAIRDLLERETAAQLAPEGWDRWDRWDQRGRRTRQGRGSCDGRHIGRDRLVGSGLVGRVRLWVGCRDAAVQATGENQPQGDEREMLMRELHS